MAAVIPLVRGAEITTLEEIVRTAESCDAKTNVLCCVSAKRDTTSSTRPADTASSSAVGSSASTQRGLPITAAAKARRCCSPPESLVGRCPPGSVKPIWSSRSPDLLAAPPAELGRQLQMLASGEVVEQVVARLLEDERQLGSLQPPESPPRQRVDSGSRRGGRHPRPASRCRPGSGAACSCPSPKGRREP